MCVIHSQYFEPFHVSRLNEKSPSTGSELHTPATSVTSLYQALVYS